MAGVAKNNSIFIRVEPDRESFKAAAAAFDKMPKRAEKAISRAFRKLSTWMRRQGVRAASQASGVTQKSLLHQYPGQKAPRYNYRIQKKHGMPVAITMWMGTYRVGVDRLGRVSWTPYLGPGSRPKKHPKRPGRGIGAKAGGKRYAGAWAWWSAGEADIIGIAKGSKRRRVLRRTGSKGTRTDQWTGEQRIVDETEIVYEHIHGDVLARYQAIEDEAMSRLDKLLTQELNYALNVE